MEIPLPIITGKNTQNLEATLLPKKASMETFF